jgi:tetratricopeptide (TPR) repeat protein
MRHSLLKGFYLRDLLIEPASGTVSGPGGSTHLQPRAIEILLHLAERPFTLVEREELLQIAWGDGQGSHEALSHAVSELRNGLDDRADDPKLIQTIPKRGYRLIEEPRPIADTEAAETAAEYDSDPGDGFVSALMRRGVMQAGLAYLIVGWLLIQIADAVGPTLGLPGWIQPLVTYTTIFGLPICLILAWVLEHNKSHLFLDRGKQSGKLLAGLERNYLAIIAAYGIAAIGAGFYQAIIGFEIDTIADAVSTIEEELLPVEPNSIAVLKFININDDENAQIFSDGLGDDVLDRLAQVPGLSVSSRGDSWSLPVNASSDLVRRRLRVAYFLEGSVRLVDDDLRVIVQLIESATGFHVFSRSFDRKLRDYLAVQQEITKLTVANLRVALPAEASTTSALAIHDDEPDVDAYVVYRRGKTLLDQPVTGKTIEEAIGYFQNALAIDDGYSAAHAGICQALVLRYTLRNDSALIDRAQDACSAALRENPNLGVVYTALGNLHRRTGNNTEAGMAFRRALDINPQDVAAMRGLAMTLERQQRSDDAESLLLDAISLQPGNWHAINTLGEFYFINGRYADAAHAFRQVVFLDPDNWYGHGNLGSALLMAGDFSAGLESLQTSLQIRKDANFLSNLGVVYYYLGEFDRSVEIHRQAVLENPDSNSVWLNLGDALRFSSQADEAANAYRKAMNLSAEALAVNPNSTEDLYIQSWATAATGNEDQARVLMDRALRIAPNDPYVRYYDGLLKHQRGNSTDALDALRQAVDMGYPPRMLAADPLLSGLSGDSRFEAIVGEI